MFLQKIEELKNKEGSYSKAATKIGITRASLSAIKRGLTHPSEQTIINLCKELNIDAEPMILKNEIEKSSGDVRKVWKQIEKKFSSIAASVALLSTTYLNFDAMQYILCKIANIKRKNINKQKQKNIPLKINWLKNRFQI